MTLLMKHGFIDEEAKAFAEAIRAFNVDELFLTR